MASDRDRLVEQITAIRHLQETGFSLGEGLVEGTCTSCREAVSSVLDALTLAAQAAPIVFRSDGGVGRLEQVGWCAQADNGDRLYTDSVESEQAATFTQGGQLFAVYRIREEAPDAILPDSP